MYKYLAKIHWGWGGQFSEVSERYVNSKEEVLEHVKDLAHNIARRYVNEGKANPYISMIDLIPIEPSSYLSPSEIGFTDTMMDEENAWWEFLTSIGEKYVNGDYNPKRPPEGFLFAYRSYQGRRPDPCDGDQYRKEDHENPNALNPRYQPQRVKHTIVTRYAKEDATMSMTEETTVDTTEGFKMLITLPVHVDDEISIRARTFLAENPDIAAEVTQEDLEQEMRFIWASKGQIPTLKRKEATDASNP